MPRINTGRENTNAVKKPAPQRRGAVGRGADTVKPAAGPPAPKPKPRPTGVFKPGVPKPATRPIIAAPKVAQRKVDTARRALPPATIAQPPVVNPGGGGGGGGKMTPAQVRQFLASRSKTAQHAREQIVKSIRINLGNTRGRERLEMTDRLLREIATDPRHARTRKAIVYYTKIERENARPQTRATAKPGPKPKKARLGVGPLSATINLTAAGTAIENAAEKAAPGLAGAARDPRAQFAKNAASDIAHLPLMVPQTAYQVSAAAYEAAGGDTKRAKQILKGFTEGVYGLAVQGKWDELEDYVRDHPVNAFLEIRGVKGVAGRGAGAALRAGVAGEKGRRVASTAREDINLSEGKAGARVADRQHYSPDVITKAFQVLNERRRGGAGKTAIRDHRLRRRADFESDTAAATSRAVRGDEARKADADAPTRGPVPNVRVPVIGRAINRAGERAARFRGRHEADIVGLLTQGVVRAGRDVERDLHKELGRLDHVYETADFSTGAQRRQNRATADAIRRVLDNPAALSNLKQVVESSRANVRAINELEGRAKGLGAITPERADRAKLFPAAQAHLGAEYSDAPFKAARGREVAAGRSLREETTRRRQRVTQAKATEQAALDRVKTLAARHKSDRGREGHNQPIAAYYVGDRRFLLRSEAVEAAKAAGVKPRDIRRVALTSGEAKRVGELSQARRAAHAATRHRRAAEADLKALNKRGKDAAPARAAFEAARSERQAAAIGGTSSLNVGGRRLPNQEIIDVIGEDVAHLPHHTQNRGARAYYQTAFGTGRKNLDSSQKRTGRAFEIGADDRSYEAVKEYRIRLRGVVNRIAEHDRIIHSIAVTGPKTAKNPEGFFTWDQAERVAANAADGGADLVPYRAVPGSYDQGRIAAIAAAQDAPEGHFERLIEDEFKQRLAAPAPGDRTTPNVVLLPKQMVQQLQQQHAVSSTAGKAGNALVTTFRTVVLPFSTKWLVGNVIEAGARLAAVGAGPNALRIGRNLLKEIEKIDRDEAIRVKAALTGGLLYGNKGLTVKRLNEHFEGTALEKPAAALSTAGQLPVVRHLGWLMKRYTGGVFSLNRWIEHNAQVAALGKHAKRELQEMTGSWAKATRAQEKAMQDLAKGYLDSKNVHDAAKYIDQTLGQYSRFSPPMRRFIQQAAPFLPWYLNAARFVFWTLPAKHPIKTGIYANVAANLQDDFDAQHEGLPPGDLRGEVVLDDGTILPVGRFLPTGAFGSVVGGGDEQLTAFIDPLFPQFKSAALAAFGLNFSGHQAKLPAGDRGDRGGVPGAVRASMALNSLAEAFIPAVGIGKRVREGGSTGYDNSTILSPKTKPGTDVKGGAANRILNPFRPVSGIKGQPRAGAQSSTAAAPQAPAPDEVEAALDAAAAALDDSALDEVSAALDVIP